MNNKIKYLFEIKQKTIDFLNQYLSTLSTINDLDFNDNNFEDKLISLNEKISFIFNELKEYNKLFSSLIEKNKNLINEIMDKIEEEDIIKEKILILSNSIIEKFSNEQKNVQDILSRLKIQNNNPLSENNFRFFEKEI